jgi:hypothetical protein
MNSQSEVKRDTEAAARGQMPFVNNKINMRIPPEEERLPGVITTEKDTQK